MKAARANRRMFTSSRAIALRPEVRVAYNDGFNATILRELLGLIEASRERIEKAWNSFFG